MEGLTCSCPETPQLLRGAGYDLSRVLRFLGFEIQGLETLNPKPVQASVGAWVVGASGLRCSRRLDW